MPGSPGILSGKANNIAFAQTSPLADNSDLWREELSEDQTKYLLDGEWRDLEIEVQ